MSGGRGCQVMCVWWEGVSGDGVWWEGCQVMVSGGRDVR